MEFWTSLHGMVEVELTSADLASALAAISKREIQLFHAAPENELSIRFAILRKDWKKLAALAEKRGDALRIMGRSGLYWQGKRLLRRPVLLIGVCLILLSVFYLPSRVFFIQVEGNERIPSRLILDEAEKCGIGFGASRRAVRSEKMKNALLSAIPNLQWAGINTKGCVAVISVRERSEEQKGETKSVVSNLVASRDGVVVSATTESGNALCKVGQAVRQGQVLISGYTDCGLTIRAERAKGEVFAETRWNFTAVTPAKYLQKTEILDVSKKYAVIIGKKRINFYKDSGISGVTCDKMSHVYQWVLPGGFTLPVALEVQTVIHRQTETRDQIVGAAQSMLEAFAKNYLQQQMVAGRILKSEPVTGRDGECFRLTGLYACCEMIGREQILEEMN